MARKVDSFLVILKHFLPLDWIGLWLQKEWMRLWNHVHFLFLKEKSCSWLDLSFGLKCHHANHTIQSITWFPYKSLCIFSSKISLDLIAFHAEFLWINISISHNFIQSRREEIFKFTRVITCELSSTEYFYPLLCFILWQNVFYVITWWHWDDDVSKNPWSWGRKRRSIGLERENKPYFFTSYSR